VSGGRRLSVAIDVGIAGVLSSGRGSLRATDQRFGEGEMLLRVGIAMLLFAVALAAVVAVVVNLPGPTEPVAPEQARSEETTAAPAGEEREVQELPVVSDDWPRPSREEIAATRDARYYAPQQDAALTLTVEGIGLYDVPVIDGASEAALEQGVIHLPQTPMPWDERDQKNVYLAGHRLGWEGTGSRLVFYNLDKLKAGDTVVLEDSLGEPYEYRVSEVFVVEPDADWVVDPVRGRDMVTLQTCTFPDLLNRLIVRADRV
jgi:sortase A